MPTSTSQNGSRGTIFREQLHGLFNLQVLWGSGPLLTFDKQWHCVMGYIVNDLYITVLWLWLNSWLNNVNFFKNYFCSWTICRKIKINVFVALSRKIYYWLNPTIFLRTPEVRIKTGNDDHCTRSSLVDVYCTPGQHGHFRPHIGRFRQW